MVKEVASKTADVVGDGTTTATVLAQALVAEGLRNVAAGANPMDLKRGMDKAAEAIVSGLREISREVGSDNSKIEQVGTPANNDKTIGSLIAEAMKVVGNEGVITVEEAKGTETQRKTVEGMHSDWRIPLTILCDQPGQNGGGTRQPLHLDSRQRSPT